MSIKLYVEGGGDSKDLKTRCRRGFRKFIESAGLEGRMPRIVACGGRDNAYDSFKTACENGAVVPMLLVDAEGPVGTSDPWQHLFDRDGWSRPDGASCDHCHLMVQLMESWFLADRSALVSFYGPDFRETALPQNPSVEKIRKEDVLRGLKGATRRSTKGTYHKASHSFAILGEIDSAVVESVAPSARVRLDALRTGGSSGG